MSLYQLPDGNWVDPKSISSIEIRGAVVEYNFLPVLLVFTDNNKGRAFVHECVSLPAAAALRDKVAGDVNELRAAAALAPTGEGEEKP